jgi:hypothetical protein
MSMSLAVGVAVGVLMRGTVAVASSAGRRGERL